LTTVNLILVLAVQSYVKQPATLRRQNWQSFFMPSEFHFPCIEAAKKFGLAEEIPVSPFVSHMLRTT
jgi:hypothetical protein